VVYVHPFQNELTRVVVNPQQKVSVQCAVRIQLNISLSSCDLVGGLSNEKDQGSVRQCA